MAASTSHSMAKKSVSMNTRYWCWNKYERGNDTRIRRAAPHRSSHHKSFIWNISNCTQILKKIKKTLWKINFSFYSLVMVFLWRTALFFLYIVRVAIFNLHAKSMWNGTPLIYLLTPWNGFLLAQHLLICIYSIRSGVSLVALPFPSAPGFLFIYTWRIARIPFAPDGTKSNCFIVIQ